MKLIRPNYSPVKDVFQDFFSNAVNRTLSDILNIDSPISQPSVNIRETPEKFEIELAAPGLEKNDFKLALENNRLSISAQKEESKVEENVNYSRKEFSFNSFIRSFDLPETVHAENISANYENGILYINLPKKEEAKPQPAKQIEIK